MVMASGMFGERIRRSRATSGILEIFKPKRDFASRGYIADVTSAVVNTFVMFSKENGKIVFPCIFSRFATQDRFEISQKVARTTFGAA